MKILPIAAALLLAAVLFTVMASDDDTDGCTGFYVGPEATSDGTFLLGQSADVSNLLPAYYEICDAVNDQPGRCIKGLSGFEYQLPDSTYRYTISRGMTITVNGTNLGQYAGSGSINSMGVACTGSITGSPSAKAIAADPYVKTGLGEDTACAIVGACASSAKEAVQLLIDIVTKYGSSESNMFIMADQDEAWYLEIYTGHQYAAVVLPSNAVVFTGNEFGLQFADSYVRSIVSPTLESFAKDKGFAVYTGGKFDIEASYSSGPTEGYRDSCHIRSWEGRALLAPSKTGAYSLTERYSLTFIPDNKVSLTDIMNVMKSRYEGTDYDTDSGSDPKYPVANDTVIECHIIQIYKDKSIPKECCCVKWQLIGKTAYGVFIPTTVGVTDMLNEFKTCDGNLVLGDSAYSKTAKLFSLISLDIKTYKTEIKNYNSEMQTYCVKTFQDVYSKYLETYKASKERADKYITDYTMELQKKYLTSLDSLNNDIAVFHSYISKVGPAYHAFFDVGATAKRYGWNVSVEGTALTLTQGSDKIVITIPEQYDTRNGYTKATVDINNTRYTDVPAYRIGDSFYIHYSDYGSLITKYSPVIDTQVQPEPQPQPEPQSETDNATVIAAVILIVCVAVVAAVIVIVARRE